MTWGCWSTTAALGPLTMSSGILWYYSLTGWWTCSDQLFSLSQKLIRLVLKTMTVSARVPIFCRFNQPVNFLYVFSIYVKLQNFLYDNFGGVFQWSFSKDKWKTFEQKGILDDSLLEDIWKKVSMQKPVLLGLMEKFDLLCPAYTQVLKLLLSPLEYLLFQPVSNQTQYKAVFVRPSLVSSKNQIFTFFIEYGLSVIQC